MFARIRKPTKLGLEVRDDSFYIFYILWKQVKYRVLKEWAELVASQLTQLTKDAIKIKQKEMKIN